MARFVAKNDEGEFVKTVSGKYGHYTVKAYTKKLQEARLFYSIGVAYRYGTPFPALIYVDKNPQP